ncbi:MULTISPECIES: UvrD-helicase domain-containing protein [unclassified Tolypothrix]|uniref:UvrD-helicase domain-containing protein n=1 Tax=unclassified Tolypothrix TaxID=2649714 RepID=UPI0005EAC3D6|nr:MULTISPECIES: UvrD-helicase domain-containing protein [unclassified Tolypothrix]BAY88189.1 TPR repeat-containing protein [Microchaete diplosiphon NIES-3275]EKF02051.1 tetratricopeptide repeat protein [Tolypothrix sp. PCC 7601]MBE9085643.1 tetratricopeptide repeat protein [Tolypothrix sp. LEGE 11397]UYD28891.1 tetratricopeptide repeat protein [Tolypothrix sp. PCC 7712]UYD35197.1 tetratricopeptide repeat protein [Tolypothrix sp. PCC 7601]
MLSIVLHPDVVKFLRKNISSNVRQKTWDCINQLRRRQFNGGLRVKRLKGINKRVWEARIDRASRLIFTYDKSRQPETGEAEVYIAIQDICLDHDDVPRKAARERTPDATWLDGEIINTLGNIESDFNELPQTERTQLEFDQLEDEDLDLTKLSDNKDELLGNIQWLIIDSPEDWQRAIINQDVDLQFKLTPEEYALSTINEDILLKGSAGTGKTTVAIYRLLNDYRLYPQSSKRLYVAYNPLLVNNAKEQFYQLLGTNNPEVTSLFQFKTLRDLCLEILELTGQSYSPEDEVNFHIFEKIYLHKERQKYPTALVWNEIRSIIKGSQLALDADYLSQSEYEHLGAKRSSIVQLSKRATFYSAFTYWYQRKIKENGRFDDIDLTRKALEVVIENNLKDYRLIVCDEVQDFTELQLEFLMRLVAPTGNLFFAGDLHQMISPSGFRWEDLTTRFFQNGRKQPLQETFTFNFRSVGTLVNLANQILQIRYRLLNTSYPYKNTQAISNYGELTRIVAASNQHLESILQTLHPGDAILVRTNPEREHLRAVFKSSLVFTIEEAKGLEFDTVFLVNFFECHQNLWYRVLQKPSRLPENEIPGLLLELNLLYVAVTRARRILNVWEEKISEFWQQPELINYYKIQDMQTIAENRSAEQVQDWQQRGEYYLKAEFYLQAVECFDKSGDRLKYLQARAKQLQKEGKYQEAAVIFAELENWETAAKLFQRVQKWEAAAHYWGKAGNFAQKQICDIHLLEEKGQFTQAAREWEVIGRYKQAAELFEKDAQWEAAANCWQQAGNLENKQICEIRLLEVKEHWEDAAQQWHQLRRFDDEKRCWMNSNNIAKKAEYQAKDFEKQKQWLQAYEQYQLAGIVDKATETCQKAIESLMASGKQNFEQQNFQEALADYTQVLQLNSQYTEAYVRRGRAKIKLKQYLSAIEDYNQALMINPQSAEIYYERGRVYQILSQLDFQKAKILKEQKKPEI